MSDGTRSESYDEGSVTGGGNEDFTYQGYLPPAMQNPNAPSPTLPPTRAPHHSYSMEDAIARKKHKRKVRRIIFKTIALLLAATLLLAPLLCCFLSMSGKLDGDDGGYGADVFYDEEEMAALNGPSSPKARRRGGDKVGGGTIRRPLPSEIELS